MNYRQIDTDFWNDEYIYYLNEREKLVFMFYFTNERVNMSGIYEMPDRLASYTLNLNKSELEEIKKKLESDRKYFFFKSWVFIPNNQKHSKYSTSKYVVKAFLNDFNKIPFDARNYFINTLKLKFTPPFDLKKITYSFSQEMEIVMEIEKEIEIEIRLETGKVPGVVKNNYQPMNEDIDPDSLPNDL